MVSECLVRPASGADVASLAALNLACWRESYADISPPELLEQLSLEERLAYWRALFSSAEGGARVSLAFAPDGAGAGFCAWRRHGLALRGRLGRGGEIAAIYLLKAAQRRGLGAMLMRRMAAEMRDDGLEWASLLVLRDNLPARRFYEAMGGRRLGGESLARGVPQLAYGWRDLSRLAADRRVDQRRKPEDTTPRPG